ncbi:hypothetical protein SCWH03_38480 [Streptomyces pacificus]|uniref:Uncharacterized protein n=2 Tax=Streptomyces pacificus TaxID=2705029 RepID=A0A6A0AXD7_9ACTN|nr:hypothetical protein SCWH03_38480 [Streptomyces pacificus]
MLVPEGEPWPNDAEPVDRVCSGWAAALAVATSHPAPALWWDADRVGFTLATGFRCPVGYVWPADGTTAGEEEAMHTFAARLALAPVLDLQALEADPSRSGHGRPRWPVGPAAVPTRTGPALPEGIAPGADTDGIRAAARAAAAREQGVAAREQGVAQKGRGRTVHAVGHRPPATAVRRPGPRADRRGLPADCPRPRPPQCGVEGRRCRTARPRPTGALARDRAPAR